MKTLKQHVVGEEDDPGIGPVLPTPGIGPALPTPGIVPVSPTPGLGPAGPTPGVGPTNVGISALPGPAVASPLGTGRTVRRRAGGTVALPGSVNIGVLTQSPGTSPGTILTDGAGGQLVGAGTGRCVRSFHQGPRFLGGLGDDPGRLGETARRLTGVRTFLFG